MISHWVKANRRAVLVLLALGMLTGAAGIPFLLFLAPGPLPTAGQTVYIRPGEALETIASELAQANVVRSPLLFRWGAAVSGQDRSIKPGVYRFARRLAPSELLDILARGGGEKSVTVPEGLTVAQVAALLEKEGLGRKNDFLRLAGDRDFAARNGIFTDNLEGYLFPDTYRLSEVLSPEQILTLMLRRFRQVVDAEIRARAAELGMTLERVVTLASMIEKETGDPVERPLVSAVFHNRLDLDMPLQSDPTVAYGLGRSDGKLSRQDLASPSPYNTYVHKGLPPTPIANPGLAAIKAALYPATSDALYFVSRNDGTHEFSPTLTAHNRAVARYQLNSR